MSTSRTPTRLSKPEGDKPISGSDFSYVTTRHRLDVFNAVHAEYDRSGIGQTVLAKRLGMDKGALSRLLGAPGNWTSDTAAKLVWAISGGRLMLSVDYPLEKSRRNHTQAWPEPEMLVITKSSNNSTAKTIVIKPSDVMVAS